MVVDDAMIMRFILGGILRENNYNVIAEASSGREAVAMYKSHRPNLVLMDITMPESGLVAVKEITEYDKNAKILMCSAMGQKETVKEAILSGAKDFLVKPLKREEVVSAVVKLIGKPPGPGVKEAKNDFDVSAPAPEEETDTSKMSNLERSLRNKLSKGID
jgi:two-component system chemotaxis response regulator CheY